MLCTKHQMTCHINSWEVSHYVQWMSHEDEMQWKPFYTNYFFIHVSVISMNYGFCETVLVEKEIQMKVSKNKGWLCDCIVRMEDVLVYNLYVISLYGICVVWFPSCSFCLKFAMHKMYFFFFFVYLCC